MTNRKVRIHPYHICITVNSELFHCSH